MYRQIFGKDQMRNSYIGQKGIMNLISFEHPLYYAPQG